MIQAYGVYEIKVIDSITNEVKQEIIKKNKLSLAAVSCICSGANLISTAIDTNRSRTNGISSYSKKVKPERLWIRSGTVLINEEYYNYQTSTNRTATNPIVTTLYKRFNPPASTRTHASFYLSTPTDLGWISDMPSSTTNMKNYVGAPLSYITLDTPCTQTTLDYLDVTYKIAIGYSTQISSNPNILPQHNKHCAMSSCSGLSSITFDWGGENTSANVSCPTLFYYNGGYGTGVASRFNRSILGMPVPTYSVRPLATATLRAHNLQGTGGLHTVSTFAWADSLTLKLPSSTIAKGTLIGQVLQGLVPAKAARDTVFPSSYALLGLTKSHSPVFKHAYGCNGPFQDLNYLGTSTGSITVSSTNYTKKELIPVFKRLDLKVSGGVGTSKYSYKDMNFCAFPSSDGNYTNTLGYFSLGANYTSGQSGDQSYAGYLNSNPTIPGLANAYALGVTNHPISEWNNNIDDSDTWMRSHFIRTDGVYVLVKRNPWSGETKYSTDNSSLANLSNVTQIAFNTTTKEFWVATSTTGLWKISDNFTTATQIDLSSYNVVTAQVYGITIVTQLGVIYCLANGGLLKSTDNGANWIKYNELSGTPFSITEINGVGGQYSKGTLYSSNIYNTELVIGISDTTCKVYKWNTTTGVSTLFLTLDTGYSFMDVNFTSKKLPNISITTDQDLVSIVAGQTSSASSYSPQVKTYINKLSDTPTYLVYSTAGNIYLYNGTSTISRSYWSRSTSLVYTIIPIKILNTIMYYISMEGFISAASNLAGYLIYNPEANVVYRTTSYPLVETNKYYLPMQFGMSTCLKLFNHKSKLGFSSNSCPIVQETWDTGYNNHNSYLALSQILPGLGAIHTPSGTKIADNGGALRVPITMTNGIPRNIGRHLAWREYMWNGSSWVMDEWAPAIDSSAKGNDGTRKFFDHGYHAFNSSSTISVEPDLPITGTFSTVAMTIKTLNYSNNASYGMPLFSRRNSASKYKTGRDNTNFSIYWSNGTTPNIAVRIGDTFTNSALNTTTYATNTDRRFVFVTESTTTKIYVDGTLVTTVTHGAQTHNIYEFMVGAIWSLENPVEFFEGTISNIQLWNKEWTLDDVFYDYNHQAGLVSDNLGFTLLDEADLHIHWKLDEDLEALELRTTHGTAEQLTTDGSTITFSNGGTGTSFVDKESMTFATLGGILKDNATTITLPDIYQNLTQDKDESNFYMSTVPAAPHVVTQLPIYWVMGGNYTFNQVVASQGAATTASPTTSYSQLDFDGDFDFTFEPSCEEYYDTRVGFTNLTPVDKVYVRFTTTNTEINIGGITTTVAIHAFGDVYRIARSGSNVFVFRNATQLASGTVDSAVWQAFVKFAHTSDAYAGISNAIATMNVPAGLVLFGDKVYYLENGVTHQKGIWFDKDYHYSPEYYNLATHKVTIDGVLTTPGASGSTQYTDKISTITASATPGSPRICKYGMIFHSSDYGKTLGGTYRYRYIGI